MPNFYVGQIDYIDQLNALATSNELVDIAAGLDALDIAVTAAAASATAAAASQTAAANSASSAATQATNATAAKNAALASQTAAGTSASAAATSQTAAASSASAAATSQTAASNSASTASTQATNAANSATTAGNHATTAGTHATNAGNSATTAGTHATNAAASATAASNSASTASTQATNASNSATTANTHATNAGNHATTAGTHATNAGNSATTAGTHATNAAASATAASNSASTASTQATNASNSATTAGNHATTAGTHATNAANSATAAAGYLAPVSGTSVTSNTIGTGSKTFTIETGKQFAVGHNVKVVRTSASTTTYMIGSVTSYTSGTGVIIINVISIAGSGTYTDWTITTTAFADLTAPGPIGSVTPSTGAFTTVSSSGGLNISSATEASANLKIHYLAAGYSNVSNAMAGLELVTSDMNTTSKYTPAIKFASADSAFTTTTPKVGALITGYATETYGADTDGGMGISFFTSANDPGAPGTLIENATLNGSGDLKLLGGIGTGGQVPSSTVGSWFYKSFASANNAIDGIYNQVFVPDSDITAARNHYGIRTENVSSEDRVETLSYNVSGATWSGGTVTLTTATTDYRVVSALTSITISGSTGTLNVPSGHGMRVGMVVTIAGSTSNANGDRTVTGITATTATFTLTGVTAGTGGTVTPKSAYFSISGVTPTGYNAYANCTIISSTQLSYSVTADPGAYTSGGIVQIDHGWAVAIYGGRFGAYNASSTGGTGQVDYIIGSRSDAYQRAGTPGKSDVTTVQGAYNAGYNSSTGKASGITGTLSLAENVSTGTVGTLYGAYNQGQNSSTAVVTDIFGTYSYSRNVNGVATNQYGSYVLTAIGASSGNTPTTTDAYGVYSRVDVNYGTLTRGFGSFISMEGTIGTSLGTVVNGTTALTYAAGSAYELSLGHYNTTTFATEKRIGISTTGLATIYGATTAATSVDTLVVKGSTSGATGAGARLHITSSDTSRGVVLEGINTGAGNNAHDLVIYTSAASAIPAERVRINSTGVVTLKTGALVEVKAAPTISTGTLSLNIATAACFAVSLNAAITTLTITGAPTSGSLASFVLEFTADGTARAVTWPASVKWAGGTAPTLTSTNTKKDAFVFYTYDAGTTYIASVIGQNF